MTALAFNPAQPRDASGRWGSGGSPVIAQDPIYTLSDAAPVATLDERLAIEGYTSLDAYTINGLLRGHPEEEHIPTGLDPEVAAKVRADYAKKTADLTGYLDRAALPIDVTVYRAMHGVDWAKALKAGDTVTDPGFMSTSMTSYFGGDLVLEIHAPAGTKAAYIGGKSVHREEREVLFQRGTTYRIDTDKGIAKGPGGDTRTLVATIIEDT